MLQRRYKTNDSAGTIAAFSMRSTSLAGVQSSATINMNIVKPKLLLQFLRISPFLVLTTLNFQVISEKADVLVT
jgi:hypothetical protein